MYFTCFFYFIRSLLLLLLFKVFAIIKISSICNCFSTYFTLFNGAIAIIFQSSLIGKYYVLSTLSYKNFLYKFPGLCNIFSYILLFNKKYFNIIKLFLILVFLFICFLFIGIFKKTIFYALPWLFCIGYILLKKKENNNIFFITFVSTWIAHGIGTIIYGLLNGFLSNELYFYLLPIAILERSLFIIISILLFYGINFLDLQLKKILAMIFKKKLIL